jgi:uncharacterized protein (TIGR02594 family)
MKSPILMTPFTLAQRFEGVSEVRGAIDNPLIMAMLRLDSEWPEHDEVPWCSAFVNYIAWLCRLPRSRSLQARSWLRIGETVASPEVGFDIVVLRRGPAPQGHVGFFAGFDGPDVLVLGGNQRNTVMTVPFPISSALDYRRL